MIRHDPQKAAYEQGCADTITRIADELDRISDSYIEDGTRIDIWEWTAKLAARIRAGEMTRPIDTGLPF